MAEPYSKDPLLAKWERTIDARTAAMIRRMGSTANPIVVYNQLPGCDDKDNLYLAILAELSGARRARARAQQVVTAFADGSGGLDSDLKEGSYEHGELYLARQILEAFDGE